MWWLSLWQEVQGSDLREAGCCRLSGICGFGLGLLFLVLLNVVVDGLWEFEVTVDVAAVGQNRKFLFRLPGEDAIAAGRTVVAAFDLAKKSGGFFWVGSGIFGEPLNHRFFGEEVVRHHGKDETPVVADVLTGVECIEKVIHHGLVAESGDAVLIIFGI